MKMHAGVAAAMTEDMMRKEMIMMKEMGANFIRLGHYQQSRIILNFAIVWEFLFGKKFPGVVVVLGGRIVQATGTKNADEYG